MSEAVALQNMEALTPARTANGADKNTARGADLRSESNNNHEFRRLFSDSVRQQSSGRSSRGEGRRAEDPRTGSHRKTEPGRIEPSDKRPQTGFQTTTAEASATVKPAIAETSTGKTLPPDGNAIPDSGNNSANNSGNNSVMPVDVLLTAGADPAAAVSLSADHVASVPDTKTDIDAAAVLPALTSSLAEVEPIEPEGQAILQPASAVITPTTLASSAVTAAVDATSTGTVASASDTVPGVVSGSVSGTVSGAAIQPVVTALPSASALPPVAENIPTAGSLANGSPQATTSQQLPVSTDAPVNKNIPLEERTTSTEPSLTKQAQFARELLAQAGASTEKQTPATAARPEQLHRNIMADLAEPVRQGAASAGTAAAAATEGRETATVVNQHSLNHYLFEKIATQQQALGSAVAGNYSGATESDELAGTEGKPLDTELMMRVPSSAVRANPVTQNTAMPVMQLATNVNHPGWSQDVGQKVLMMVRQDIQQAQLQLNPAHLGPIEVKISMGHDQQVNITFLAQNSAVREALDSASVRLREMLDSQGLNLNEFNVSQESFKQRQDQFGYEDKAHGNQRNQLNESDAEIESPSDSLSVLTIAQTDNTNSVDYYA